MPHYRTMLSSVNFCAADLWSEQKQRYMSVVVEIVEIKKGSVVGEGGRKRDMPMATLRSGKTGKLIEKPLGLNATNCKTLSTLAGSEVTEKWCGLWIGLFVIKTTVGREQVDAVRISPERMQPPVQSGKQSTEPAPGPRDDEPPRDFDPTDVQPEDRQ